MELALRIAQARSEKSPPATAVMRTGFGIYSAPCDVDFELRWREKA